MTLARLQELEDWLDSTVPAPASAVPRGDAHGCIRDGFLSAHLPIVQTLEGDLLDGAVLSPGWQKTAPPFPAFEDDQSRSSASALLARLNLLTTASNPAQSPFPTRESHGQKTSLPGPPTRQRPPTAYPAPLRTSAYAQSTNQRNTGFDHL